MSEKQNISIKWIEEIMNKSDKSNESDGNNELTKQDLLELLKYHQVAEWKTLHQYSYQKNIFIGIFLAVLAVNVSRTDSSNFIFNLLVSPFLVIFSSLAILTLDRYYNRFLEAVIGTSKIQYLLGLDQKVNYKHFDTMNPQKLFPNDTHLDVNRRWQGKFEAMDSDKWAYSLMNKGHNELSLVLFHFFCFASIFPSYWPLYKQYDRFGFVDCQDHLLFLASLILSLTLAILSICCLIPYERKKTFNQLPNKNPGPDNTEEIAITPST